MQIAAYGKAEGVPVSIGLARTPRLLSRFVDLHKIFEKTFRVPGADPDMLVRNRRVTALGAFSVFSVT